MLNVDFHDGKTDVAILMPRMYDGELDTSILNGNLKEETPSVEVSVNGRPNDKTFDVSLLDIQSLCRLIHPVNTTGYKHTLSQT